MKAVVLYEYGGPEVLKLGELSDPVPGAGEVLVKTAAASINPVDTFERAGKTKDWRPIQFPGVIGWDISGTIISIGPGVSGFAVGDQVLAWAYHTYAELCVIKTDLLAKVPEGLALTKAAALPLVTLTGSQLITAGADVKHGQTVLVSGATGAVGRAAVFTAKETGAYVIAGVNAKHVEAAKSLGADQVVALDDSSALKSLPLVDVVANCVRGSVTEQLIAKVKPGGVYASVTGAPDNAKAFPTVRVVAYVSKQDAVALGRLAQAIHDDKFDVPVGRTFPFSEAAAAHALFETGGIGKVLLVP